MTTASKDIAALVERLDRADKFLLPEKLADMALARDAKALIEALVKERDEAQSCTTAWSEIIDGLRAHLQDRITMKDPASPATYLSIIDSYVASIERSSQQIVNARWADYRRQSEALAAAQAKIGRYEAALLDKRLPRLTRAMIEAACAGHFGKERTRRFGIDGINLTSWDRDWTFQQGFRRMWRGLQAYLDTNPAVRQALSGSGD